MAEAAAVFERLKREDEQTIRKEGYLSKRGGGRKSKKFKKRWFVLRLNMLEYWVDERKKTLKGAIRIPGSSITMAAKSQFELITSDRVFVMMAPSDGVRQGWVDAFNEVYAVHRDLEDRKKGPQQRIASRPKTTPPGLISKMRQDEAVNPVQSVPAVMSRADSTASTSSAPATPHAVISSVSAPDIDGITDEALLKYTKMAPPPPPPAGESASPPASAPVVTPIPTRSEVRAWTVAEVCSWVESIGCSPLSEAFAENEIQGEDLLELSRDELTDDLDIRGP
eukprot:CAMPEP_0174241182 /NCGR_PEP_ID=MMETSP0417-20130205/22112_1 /TAXON_ID=242541 /ORGANISM="Mayorella sp, Strain BSH-02190019" /LENGTH=280 /DNA_ID=CAMNT_0015320385 /DNA_START=243 /DNA_END=1081 /DNA_ORIENTATION=-